MTKRQRFNLAAFSLATLVATAFLTVWLLQPPPEPARAQSSGVYRHALFADVSVKDNRFGAKGDASTDDTSAIQAAIDFVDGLGGGTVWFPPGTYVVTGTITLPQFVDLKGTQEGGVRYAVSEISHEPTVANTDLFSLETDPTLSAYNYPGEISDLHMNGNSNSRYGVRILHPSVRMTDVAITEFQYPVLLRSGIRCLLDRVYINARTASGTGSVGIVLDDSGGFEGTTLSINDSSIRLGDWAITTDIDSYNRIFINNTLIESTWKGAMQIAEGTAFICCTNLDLENIGREADGSAMFELGLDGDGTTDTYGYFINVNANAHTSAGRDTRKCFDIGDGIWTFTNIFCNSCEAGVFNTSAQTDQLIINNTRVRNFVQSYFGSVADWGKVRWTGFGAGMLSDNVKAAYTHADLSGTTTSVTFDGIAADCDITGVYFLVSEAVVDDGGDDTWSAKFDAGLPLDRDLAADIAAAAQTTYGVNLPGMPPTDGTLTITFTPNGGSFTAGEIHTVVYYRATNDANNTLDPWFDNLGVGREPENHASSVFNVRTGSGRNLLVKDDSTNNGVRFEFRNDAESALRDFSVRASEYHFGDGLVQNETLESINTSTTTTQGANAITDVFNEYDAILTGEVATLPAAEDGRWVWIINNDADTDLLVWPASGDQIDDAGVDTQITVPFGERVLFICVNATDWYTSKGRQWTSAFQLYSVEENMTATASGVQGDTPITTEVAELGTVASGSDACTLPSAQAGLKVVIINNGANAADVYPASGDSIDGGSVDASVNLPAGAVRIYHAINATEWYVK